MQHLLLIDIVLLIAGLAFVLVKWPGGKHMTFSQHVAVSRASQVYYSLLFLVTLPLLLWFFVGWLVPEKGLPVSFTWFAVIAVLFQILCTFVPETGGRRTTMHRLLTGISGVAMLPLVVIIAMAADLSTSVHLVAWLGLTIMASLLGIALANQKGFPWALWLQIGYYAVFFVVMLSATYL